MKVDWKSQNQRRAAYCFITSVLLNIPGFYQVGHDPPFSDIELMYRPFTFLGVYMLYLVLSGTSWLVRTLLPSIFSHGFPEAFPAMLLVGVGINVLMFAGLFYLVSYGASKLPYRIIIDWKNRNIRIAAIVCSLPLIVFFFVLLAGCSTIKNIGVPLEWRHECWPTCNGKTIEHECFWGQPYCELGGKSANCVPDDPAVRPKWFWKP